MKKEIKIKQRGITLIALVITIIVLLILAGVTIATLTGENGILNKAEKAAEETLIKGYEEKIRLATTEGNSNALIEPEKYEDEEDILDDIGNIIKKDSQFEESKIYKTGSGTEDVKLVVVTKEGYIYYVEVDKTEYAGTKEEVGDIILDIEIQTGDIVYTCDPTTWTNGIVTVTIEIVKEEYKGYEIEYSYDTKTWNKYEEGQTITVTNNNTTIYTRLRSDNAVLKGYATGNVTNIDRLEPKEFTPTAESTTNSITVKAEVTDKEATEIDGCSGIAGYRFSIDNGTTWTEYQESGTYTWNDLAQTTEYTIKVETKDNAGNLATGTITKGTGTIETASGTITFGNLSWSSNKASVTVTKNTTDSLTIEYKINDGSYISIASGGIISNLNLGDVVTVRLTDGINYGSTASLTVTDTTAPNLATITLSNTTTNTASSITVTVTQSDSQSGVNIEQCRWMLSTNSSDTIDESLYSSENTFDAEIQDTITLSSQTEGTYYLHILTVDNAGNKKETVSEAIIVTRPLPTIGSVTGSTSTANSGTITVSSISDTGGSGLSGIYISTSSDKPSVTSTEWIQNSSSSYIKTVTENGTYYVWVKDNAGYISEVKSCTVSGIVPKVTGVTLTDATVKAGYTVTISKSISGSTSYKSIIFTSSNTGVATIVSGTGIVTGKTAGTTTIKCTVTNYDGSTVQGTCVVTVVTIEIGNSHTPKEITYSWEELNKIAKVISDNNGTITRRTREVTVAVEGKWYTLGIGDTTTVTYDGQTKTVRILGFNHDRLVDITVYGGDNIYAGISFEFEGLLRYGCIDSDESYSNVINMNWASCQLREELNNTETGDIAKLSNKNYIKRVRKNYLEEHDHSSTSECSDYLWLLSMMEIYGIQENQNTEEGSLYCFYWIYDTDYNSSDWETRKFDGDESQGWWTRTLSTIDYDWFRYITMYGNASNHSMDYLKGISPGFAI